MPARLANLGYLALKKQSDKDVAVIPNVYVPVYSESFNTMVNLDADNPIAGNKAAIFQHIQGVRHHMGEVQVLAEPTTAGYFFDMLLKKGSTTDANPLYTHPFTLSADDPNAYTVDICKGQVVYRFIGVEAYELSNEYDENKMLFNVSMSARKSFIAREVSSLAGDAITFKTDYDASPTTGLVVGDLMRLHLANGTTLDLTIESVDSAVAVTFTTTPTGAASGDIMTLRPATPSFSLVTPFQWARTEFRFAADASNALSATHTPLQPGSQFIIQHNLEENEGAKRSGSYDPAELARTQGDAELNVKVRFDTPNDMNRFLTNQKRACVIRMFSGATHELRVTLNNLKFTENPVELNTGEVVYAEGPMKPQYDTSDAQSFDVKVLNSVSSI
jgi:hypothetical protein